MTVKESEIELSVTDGAQSNINFLRGLLGADQNIGRVPHDRFQSGFDTESQIDPLLFIDLKSHNRDDDELVDPSMYNDLEFFG